MESSSEVDKLLPALLKARKEIKPAKKGARNEFDKYNYATQEHWHEAVMPALLANDLLLSISTVEVLNLEVRQTKKGDAKYAVQVTCAARLWHVSGQWVEIMGAGHGEDRADKGVYKAMTGAAKYLYAQLFALPTTDDPEKDSDGRSAAPKASTPDESVEDLL